MEILIDTNKETREGIRNAIRMLQSLIGHIEFPDELVASERTSLIFKDDAPTPPPPPQSMTPVVPVAATNTTNATEDASSTGTIPIKPTTSRAPAAPGVEVDSTGAAWNNKLHTSTKTKDIDGKWKPRKSRDATPPTPPQVAEPIVPVGTTYGSTPTPPPPKSMTPPPPPPPPTVLVPSAVEDDADIEPDTAGGAGMVPEGAETGIDFASFIVKVTTASNDGSLSQERLAEVQKQFGLVSLFSLNESESAKLQDVARAFGFVS